MKRRSVSAIASIQKILYKAVQDGGFGLDIAYENVKFDPKSKDGYLSCFMLRAPTLQAELGWVGCDLHTGIFQIDINYPQDSGATAHAEMCDQINAFFKSGATFAGPTESVNIQNVSAGVMQVAQGWATLSLSIQYYVFSGRVQ